MKLNFALPLFAHLLLFTACKDKIKNSSPSLPCTDCQQLTEAKDFFYFKVGSWWVYEEQTSHLRDSMYVFEAAENPTGYQFDVRIQSDLTGYEYHYWPIYHDVNNNCTVNGNFVKRCLYIKRSKAKFQDHLGESNVLFVKYKKGEMSYTDYCNECHNIESYIQIGEVFDNYSVLNYTFDKTVKVYHSCNCAEGRQPTNMYYSKQIGVVRKELLDSNQVWNLVNYHIEE